MPVSSRLATEQLTDCLEMVGKVVWIEKESVVMEHLSRVAFVSRLLGLPYDSGFQFAKSAIPYTLCVLLLKAWFLSQEFINPHSFVQSFPTYYILIVVSIISNDLTILYNVLFKNKCIRKMRKALLELESVYYQEKIKWQYAQSYSLSFHESIILLYWMIDSIFEMEKEYRRARLHHEFFTSIIISLLSEIRVCTYLCFSIAMFSQFTKFYSLTHSMMRALTEARTDPDFCLRCSVTVSSILAFMNEYFGMYIFLFVFTFVLELLVGLYTSMVNTIEFKVSIIILPLYVIVRIVSSCHITNLKVRYTELFIFDLETYRSLNLTRMFGQ